MMLSPWGILYRDGLTRSGIWEDLADCTPIDPHLVDDLVRACRR